MSNSNVENRLRFKYSNIVVLGCSVYLALIAILATINFGQTPSVETYLLISVVNGTLAISSFYTGLKSKGLEKVGWFLLFAISVLRVISNLSRYPQNSEPSTPTVLVAITVICFILLFFLFWNKFQGVSWMRVTLDSLWITACIMVSVGFFITNILSSGPNVSTANIIALLAPPTIILMVVTLCINGWAHSYGRGFTVIGLLLGSFCYLTGLAVHDALRSLELVDRTSFVEWSFLVADVGLVAATQFKFNLKSKTTMDSGDGKHVILFTIVPIAIATLALIFSAPPKFRVIVALGIIVVLILGIRLVLMSIENIRLNSELKSIAKTDSLTGLTNKLGLENELNKLDPTAHVLYFIDLDYFKEVNDHYGHEAGDEALVRFTERLNSKIRLDDKAYRLGGDEFVVISKVTQDEQSNLAERLREIVESEFNCSFGVIKLGATIGVCYGEHGFSGAQWLKNADRAMYLAKNKGRGSVITWQDNQQAPKNRKTDLFETNSKNSN